ncbi:MAG: DUF2007 domain-containing protein [Bacteroidetes bacterium]|nr:DUF2007 domain-containing protein [Bacteroidota bacterium]
MKEWQIIITFTYPHEAHMARSFLEAAGFETTLGDELTSQVNNFYSTAIGGVKLLVEKERAEEAIAVLKNGGYMQETDVDKPYKLNFFYRNRKVFWFFIVVIGAIFIYLFITVINNLPSQADKLTNGSWCLYEFYYDNYELLPYTVDSLHEIKFTPAGGCSENIKFWKNGFVVLPGFNGPAVVANWEIAGNKINIKPLNGDSSLMSEDKSDAINNQAPLETIYYGEYRLKFDGESFYLESSMRYLSAYKNLPIW